jgi:hypothetical protein
MTEQAFPLLQDRVAIVTGAGMPTPSPAAAPRLIEFDADVPIDAATLAGRYEEIFDASRYTTPKSSMEVLASVFGGPSQYGSAHRNR